MSKDMYTPKGYHIDVSKTAEAMTRNAIDYVGFSVGIAVLLSYFFFNNWLLELLIASFFITSLKIAFLNHLTDEALKQERLITNEEFMRIHERIDEIKRKNV